LSSSLISPDHLFLEALKTSRSLYERAKEHQRDRDAKEEDSHQVKHWMLDHPDLASPPKFKFSIISTFQDPLTRQLAESVRIEKGGENILNSKSEYSLCRVPRLVIDMEGWRKTVKTVKKPLQSPKTLNASGICQEVPCINMQTGSVSITALEDTRVVEEIELEGLETVLRRMDTKRKGEEPEGKKTKKRKFPRLEGWGEADNPSHGGGLDAWVCQDEM
jgi:hypothetical protein